MTEEHMDKREIGIFEALTPKSACAKAYIKENPELIMHEVFQLLQGEINDDEFHIDGEGLMFAVLME